MIKNSSKMRLHPQEQFHLMEQQRESNLKKRRASILEQMKAKRECLQSLAYVSEDDALVYDRMSTTVESVYIKKEDKSQEEEEDSESEMEENELGNNDGTDDDDDNDGPVSELSNDDEGKETTDGDSEDSELGREVEVSDFF
jgi:hypothetical protein